MYLWRTSRLDPFQKYLLSCRGNRDIGNQLTFALFFYAWIIVYQVRLKRQLESTMEIFTFVSDLPRLLLYTHRFVRRLRHQYADYEAGFAFRTMTLTCRCDAEALYRYRSRACGRVRTFQPIQFSPTELLDSQTR